MIDLEAALADLVEVAPAPPETGAVTRRARQRHARKRGTQLIAALAVVVCGVGATIALRSTHHARRVILQQPPVDSVRVTLLDGSQLEISGPKSLGLTTLDPAFNGELVYLHGDDPNLGHSFSVLRTAPAEPGAVVARYPTGDGHELVVHKTERGTDAVVQYDHWAIVVGWNGTPGGWPFWAESLHAHETPDGFLVIDPASRWRLGPTDAPEVQLGGTLVGSDATYSFFGPRLYPNGCPSAAETTAHTPQGWNVFVGTDPSKSQAREWCDADERVRIMVGDPQLGDAAVAGLRVAFSDADRAVYDVTTLTGDSLEITAPASVFTRISLNSAVYVDGLDEPNLLRTTPNLLPVNATRAGMPTAAAPPTYTTADGHRLLSYVPPTDCGCDVLAGSYGKWLVTIEVQGMSTAQRTLIASKFAAHEAPDGFLALDPVAPMHIGTPSFAGVVFQDVGVYTTQKFTCAPPDSVDAHTPEGLNVHIAGNTATWCDPNDRLTLIAEKSLIDKVRARRLP